MAIFLFFFFTCSVFGQVEEGWASYYANMFHGRTTASGEIFNTQKYTAAHKSLPFGTKVKVTNLNNGKSIIVKINDRGPFVKNRIIDLAPVVAQKLGFIQAGVAKVKIEIVEDDTAITGEVMEERRLRDRAIDFFKNAKTFPLKINKEKGTYVLNALAKSASNGYGVKVAEVKSEAEVFKHVNQLATHFSKKIRLYKSDENRYLIVVNRFKTEEEAARLNEILKTRFPSSEIVDYQQLSKLNHTNQNR